MTTTTRKQRGAGRVTSAARCVCGASRHTAPRRRRDTSSKMRRRGGDGRAGSDAACVGRCTASSSFFSPRRPPRDCVSSVRFRRRFARSLAPLSPPAGGALAHGARLGRQVGRVAPVLLARRVGLEGQPRQALGPAQGLVHHHALRCAAAAAAAAAATVTSSRGARRHAPAERTALAAPSRRRRLHHHSCRPHAPARALSRRA